MTRVGIIAAMPGELKPLVKGWKRIPTTNGTHRWEMESDKGLWIAVCAGIGRDAATHAFAEAASGRPLNAVLSIGWAGSLTSEIAPSAVCNMAQVVDARTGEQFQLVSSNRKLRLITSARVADAGEKSRLAQAYPGGVLVDMEAATVARLATTRGIPCYCIKAVSDAVDERLPDMNPFIGSRGEFRTAAFVASVILRPQYWGALMNFGRNSAMAAANLGENVRAFLESESYLVHNR
jgi:adenosylhomocysteine nucleosidase